MCIVRAAAEAGRGSVNGNFKLKFRISLETNSGTLTEDWDGMGGGSQNLNEHIIKQIAKRTFFFLLEFPKCKCPALKAIL